VVCGALRQGEPRATSLALLKGSTGSHATRLSTTYVPGFAMSGEYFIEVWKWVDRADLWCARLLATLSQNHDRQEHKKGNIKRIASA